MSEPMIDLARYEIRHHENCAEKCIVWMRCKWCDKVILNTDDDSVTVGLGKAIGGTLGTLTMLLLGGIQIVAVANHEKRCTSRMAN